MSSLHSVKKEIAKRDLMFQPAMYNNTVGSVVISAFIFSADLQTSEVPRINKKWNRLVKGKDKIDFWIDDPKFIDKVLDFFEIEKPFDFPIAMVQSDFNVLFMPYVDGSLLPLREDGIYPQTARKGKIYPIKWNGTNIDDEVMEIGEVATNCEDK